MQYFGVRMEIDYISRLYRQDFTEFKNPIFTSKWNLFILVEAGEFWLKLENRQNPIVIKENEIAFVPPGVEMERRALTPISFHQFAFYAEAEHSFYRSITAGKLPLPTDRAKSIIESVGRTVIIADNRELITHIIEHIFSEHYLFGRSPKTKLVPFSEEITSTVSYIQKNLAAPLDVDELAARVFLSHSGLIWKFKKELGTTPSQYINIQRLRYAKQLLLNNPSYTVAQIAEMCGYTNPFYFTNRFREYSGMSPTRFRRFHLEK